MSFRVVFFPAARIQLLRSDLGSTNLVILHSKSLLESLPFKLEVHVLTRSLSWIQTFSAEYLEDARKSQGVPT